jgi:hypothetical protein
MGKHRDIFEKSTFYCPDKGKISITVGANPQLLQITPDKFKHFVAGEILFSFPWALRPRLFKFGHFMAKKKHLPTLSVTERKKHLYAIIQKE